MKHKTMGFVFFAVMLVITVIALFSLTLLRTETDNLHLARTSLSLEIAKIKAKTVMQSLAVSDNSEALSCDQENRSPDSLLHADDAWWKSNACASVDGVLFVRESPILSETSITMTKAGWVATQYRRITLRYQTKGMPPVLMQALIAEPSTVKVQESKGRAVAALGSQQLECLSD